MSFLKCISFAVIMLGALGPISCLGEEWERVSSDEGLNKVYYDLDSLESNEEGVSLWIMVDFATSVMGVLSRKTHIDLNCKQRTYRLYRQILYEDHLGSGQSYISDIKSTKMSEAASNPVVSVVMDVVCQTTH